LTRPSGAESALASRQPGRASNVWVIDSTLAQNACFSNFRVFPVIFDFELRHRDVTFAQIAFIDLAAQILLIIQGKAQNWVEDGRVAARWGPSARNSLGRLVERLLPLARAQLLVFETEGRRRSYTADGPAKFLRLTGDLQKRIAGLSNLVRDQTCSIWSRLSCPPTTPGRRITCIHRNRIWSWTAGYAFRR
jgi:hypothetical protein